MTHVACESKLRSVVRPSMPRKLGGNRAYGRVLPPGLSTHSVQELNVGTVRVENQRFVFTFFVVRVLFQQRLFLILKAINDNHDLLMRARLFGGTGCEFSVLKLSVVDRVKRFQDGTLQIQ